MSLNQHSKESISIQTIHIVLFSALFPHDGEPTLGIFVENRLRHLLKDENVSAVVVAPVPWFPFKSDLFGAYGRAARAKKIEYRDGLEIHHPRYLVIPKIGMMMTPFFLARAGYKCIQQMLKKGVKIDLIDAHYLYPDGVAAAQIAKKLNLPFVMTARGSDVTQIAHIKGPQTSILNAIKQALHVITVSQSLKDKLISLGADSQKITPLRNGVELQRYQPVDNARRIVSEELKFDIQKPIAVFAGWLIPRKRVDIIVEVLSLVPELQAIIIGDGPLRPDLIALARSLGVENRTRFIGQKQPADIPLYFSASDILILPSEREGWANVLLEAMACGTPVISRAVDGACELVVDPDAGRLVDENALANAYAEAIVDLLAHMPQAEKVTAYAANYGWEETSRGQYAVFRRAIIEHMKPITSDVL